MSKYLDSQGLTYLVGKLDARFEKIGHNHDADYSAIDHTHDDKYAVIGHDHDGDYSAIDHDHDDVYSKLDHAHDDKYAVIDHTHSWNDLTERPFGEEITTVVTEPFDVTFNSMDGLESFVFDPEMGIWGVWYKLSDAVPTIDQIKNFSITVNAPNGSSLTSNMAEDWDENFVEKYDNAIINNNMYLYFILEDNVTLYAGEEGEMSFPTAGIYITFDFTSQGGSLRISAPEVNYINTEVTKLDPQYLPDLGISSITTAEIDAAFDDK